MLWSNNSTVNETCVQRLDPFRFWSEENPYREEPYGKTMKIPTLLMALVATSVGYLTPASTVSALLILSPPPSPPLALDGNRPQQRHSCCSASSFAYKSNIVGNARRLSRDHERADASPATKRDALKMMVSSSMGGSSPGVSVCLP